MPLAPEQFTRRASLVRMPSTWRTHFPGVTVSLDGETVPFIYIQLLLTLLLHPLQLIYDYDSVGPAEEDTKVMLQSIGFDSFESLVNSTVPANILSGKELNLEPALSETEALKRIKSMADKNTVMKSYIGMGYYDTIVPNVILRNMLENPGWYTAYTPYQAEIAQGRLEMLLNFQTLCSDLTGLPMSVASLLDESTAAAEAMQMCFSLKGKKGKKNKFFVSQDVHPQTISLIQTRAAVIGIDVVVGEHSSSEVDSGEYCGAVLQYPNTYGAVESSGESYEEFTKRAHTGGAMVIW